VLAGLPGILLDVVRQVLDQPDLEVVVAIDDATEMLQTIGHSNADVVVLGVEGELPAVASQILDQYPHVNVLAVTPDARRAYLYKLEPQLTALGELSPDRLLTAIRATERSWPVPGG
jgi:DNA-binding NarL/FixJ family response regulator